MYCLLVLTFASNLKCHLQRAALNIEGRIPRAKLFCSSRKRRDGTSINEHNHETIVSSIVLKLFLSLISYLLNISSILLTGCFGGT